MTFDKYISHPASTNNEEPTLLLGNNGRIDDDGHLQTVAKRMANVCGGKLSDGTPCKSVAETIGLTHDFTKLTKWVQMYLREISFKKEKQYRYHAFSSSLVTLYCLQECNKEVSDHAAEVATVVVAGHHNINSPPEPKNLEDYARGNNAVYNRYERVEDQFDNIAECVPQRANRIIQAATNGEGSWEEFRDWFDARTNPIDDINDLITYFARIESTPPNNGYYSDIVRLWSALKFADQTAASGLQEQELNGVLPDKTKLDNHVNSLDVGEGVLANLNNLRDQARKDVTKNTEHLIKSSDVGLITLPTGFGKTYAGISAGLQAAQMSNSRLVYVLPYTSILDQTADEIESIFNINPYSKEFTLHHHLSDTYTGLKTDHTDGDIGRSPGALHAESWLSGLTLTTTVQLFESLTAPTARQATRIPSFHDAVVVIDEPQAIPENWWKIVPKLIELLVNEYNTTVILMTATQPGIVKYGAETVDTMELTDNTDQYIDFLDNNPRVTYHLHDTVQSDLGEENATLDYATAGSRIIKTSEKENDVLAICNTRNSAKELYRHVIPATMGVKQDPVELGQLLNDYISETGEMPTPIQLRKLAHNKLREQETNTVYAFLSGDVRPDDRSLLIDAIYNEEIGNEDDHEPLLNTDISVVLISTSVVEAGVDVSFDTVFRDYAPIPNIVQSGGRCNRSFDGEIGNVIIWRLAEPEDKNSLPSLIIHGGDGGNELPLLQETGRVLRRHASNDGTINEATMVSKTVNDFYQSLFEGQLDPGDERLVEAIDSVSMSKLEGENMINEFENYDDVLVCLTDDQRKKLLNDPTIENIMNHAGTQVNTNSQASNQTVVLGNSEYIIIDGRNDESYHPVFGVQ